jgi:RNA polymerase sigma-70 factor (ECF subfamily)
MPIDACQLEELLDRYWSVLIAWLGGPREDAEDAVQAAFIKLATETPVPENCVAWLFTVSKRLAINAHTSRSRRRSLESTIEAKSSDRTTSPFHDILDLLNTLDVREREIVVARIWGHLTFDEIAQALNESKASIWRCYQTGIRKLKNSYNELLND